MQCPACGQQNPGEARFCIACSQGLGRICPACGTESPAQARFCMACAAPLDNPDTSKSTPTPVPAAPPQNSGRSVQMPTSFADGRYHVKRFLGEGGKKKVYLAHDTTLDREVAFALIKTEGLDDTSRQRIQREAQAMGRLGSHPHIVTVFDLGQESGRGEFETRPYMVTELMGGGDVEALIENAGDHRLPLEQAIKIAQETCRGLEFAHGRGIVHRDLKPGNVWLTSDGVAKIGDFGLAVALDRSRLTTEGMMVGTVSYMPPEQAMGGEVTPKSDLYSLGAMLYEMVTGRPPFLGDDSVAIIGQHINTPPVAPTWHNSECPRALDALILRLLAKDPSERPESAADVLAALNGIDLAGDVGAQGLAPLHGEEHSLDSLAGGVFVGRQREMGDLKACLEDALSGRGRLVTLVGEPGIGKTRIAQELATYAGLRGAQVLWGRCYEEQGVPPYWPWVQAIRSYVREKDPEELRSEMGAGAADIAEVVSDVRERLPGLQPAPQLEPEQARFRLFDSIASFLKTASQRRPLVLVLDDLHWADHPSLLLLEFVARELGGARLLLIGTYRDMELSRQHPLSQTLAELTRSAEGGFQRVLLRGLGQDDVGRFIELVSGVTPPRGMVEAVHRQTEGNPLFVTEVVRLLVQEGELTQDPSTGSGQTEGRESWSVRIPEGVREVIGRRLDRLSERCNETLTIASVVGREFTIDQLSPLIDDISGDRLFEVLDEALSSRVIEELPRPAGRYQFTHALIQETLAGELSTTRKVRLHARIAHALEVLYGADAEAHAAELAHHFAQAEAMVGTEKLVHYSLLAGERALTSFAFEEALAHYERGLASRGITLTGSQPAPDEEAAALLFGLGRAQAATLPRQQTEDAVATLARALDFYVEEGDVERAVATAEIPIQTVIGQPSGAAQLVVRALALAPVGSHEAGRLLYLRGRALGTLEGDYEGAQKAFEDALAIALSSKDPVLEMRTLAQACYVDMFQMRFQECIEKGLAVISRVDSIDEPRSELTARYYVTPALCMTGDLQRGREQAMAMLATAERLHDSVWLGNAIVTNEFVCRISGEWQAARDFADRLPNITSQDPRWYGRAQVEYEVGNFDQGLTYLSSSLESRNVTTRELTTEITHLALTIALVNRITDVTALLQTAGMIATTVVTSQSATPLTASVANGCLGLIAIQRGDIAMAAKQYSILESSGGTLLGPRSTICTDHLLGLLTQTMDKLDQAAVHFEDALSFCRGAGYRPELAWTCCDYADMLQARAGEGDRAKAVSLLDESLAVSSELGMRPLMERVLSRREILKA